MHLLLLNIKTVFSQKIPHISQSSAAALSAITIKSVHPVWVFFFFFFFLLYCTFYLQFPGNVLFRRLGSTVSTDSTDCCLLLMGSKECADGFSETFDSFMTSHTQFILDHREYQHTYAGEIPDCSTFHIVRAKTCSCVNPPFVMSQ